MQDTAKAIAQARRDAAVRAFWSDRPLNLACREVVGQTFTLKALIAFAEGIPQERFDQLTGDTNGPT